MSKSVAVLFVIFTLNYSLIGAIISSKETDISPRLIGQTLSQCFVESEIFNCLANKISETLDKAIANNETWQLSDFLAIEKNKNHATARLSNTANYDQLINLKQPRSQQDHLDNKLAMKMLQMAQARSLRLQLPSVAVTKMFDQRAINSALDDFNTNGAAATTEQEEGRKRKHKDKNMAVLGGMAMLAMVAQMFLGKVILIAGAAFIMAKVALLISALGSLKHGTSGSPAGNDHVIVTRGGVAAAHSHEHISDWHRRSPYEHNNFEVTSATGTLTNRSKKLL